MGQLAAALPKAELHCHLEGTVSPCVARRLAARHGTDVASFIDAQGRYIWNDFTEFLNAYDAMAELIRTPRDYYDITRAYFEDCAAGGVIYGEVFISPEHAQRQGISYTDMVDAIADAMHDVHRAHDIHGRMIVVCIRHLGAESATATARLAAAHPHPLVTGFGMAGEESAYAPRDFQRAFAIAADAGLGLTAHAGEHLGPDHIRATIRDLNVSRIGHGVRACEDPALIDELRDLGTVLELCPSSNICLEVAPDFARHPVGKYLAAGLKATISSDDPPFFYTTVMREYEQVAAAQHMDAATMLHFTRNAIAGAFCPERLKAKLRERVDRWAADEIPGNT